MQSCYDVFHFHSNDWYFFSCFLAAMFCGHNLKHPKGNDIVCSPQQDGVMVPYTKELGDKMKHGLKQLGKKYIFSLRDLMPDDAGLYQVDVGDVNVFSTDFKSKLHLHTRQISIPN